MDLPHGVGLVQVQRSIVGEYFPSLGVVVDTRGPGFLLVVEAALTVEVREIEHEAMFTDSLKRPFAHYP